MKETSGTKLACVANVHRNGTADKEIWSMTREQVALCGGVDSLRTKSKYTA